MRDMNKVILFGRLGQNPVLRATKKGFPVAHFSLATKRRFRSEAAPEGIAEETQWHRITVWGKQGEACANHLKKGQTALVEGLLRSHSYVGRDGVQRTAVEVHADSVSFQSLKDVEPPASEPTAEDVPLPDEAVVH